MKDQATIPYPKLTNHIEMFANENYIDEPQDTELNRTTTNFNKESKEFKEDIKKQLDKIKESKQLSDTQENRKFTKLSPTSSFSESFKTKIITPSSP